MTLTGDNAKGHVTFTRDKCIQPEDVIEKFFDAFENADYETMKQYCTTWGMGHYIKLSIYAYNLSYMHRYYFML